MKIYISGKISGLSEHEYTKNFNDAAHETWVKYPDLYYVNIVNPIRIKPFLGIKNWIFYMIADIREQRKCTHSAFQPNWIDSKGAVIEYFLAKFIFKQIIIFL